MIGSMHRGLSKDRSTAKAFGPMWRRFFYRHFVTYVAKVLLPTLRPGDIVVMDNLGSHKGKIVRQLIRSAGAKLFFLPKYSPDLNPIEQVFAKLKHLLRKAAARTVDAVCAAIGDVLHAFTPEECSNYLKNSGYRS
jgi:transposase